LALLVAVTGCRADEVIASIDEAGATSDSDGPTGTSTTGDEAESGDGMPKLDVGPGDVGDGGDCKVADDMNAIGECEAVAPPDSFEPARQWAWEGESTWTKSVVTPLVANLTDDDENGEVDLCDTPDVVLVAMENHAETAGRIFVLDGETGTTHFSIDDDLASSGTPALGDIDDDGAVDIVAFAKRRLRVYERDGSLKWTADFPGITVLVTPAVALADVDNDGDVEIVLSHLLYDHEGNLLMEQQGAIGSSASATAIADLDGDGDQEIIFTRRAVHHDGSLVYQATGEKTGFPQVANLDDDPEPEVLVVTPDGISLYDHDGTPHYEDLKPVMFGENMPFSWGRPATVHDLDGDGKAEFAVSAADVYVAYQPDGEVLWFADIDDASGSAAGTAFDFLGDGTPEAMYSDEENFFVFDDTGSVLMQVPRVSGTIIEYPVVADIDDDGSAEVLVTSAEPNLEPDMEPPLQAIRDMEDRWIQARRIWNQHTYHVTNVREDGTIPQFEPPHWELLNTYRTNAQIEGGALCEPAG
jgi:hypothetical protein